MWITKIDFNKFEPYNWDTKKSFEQLCYQVVYEEFKDEIINWATLTPIDDSWGWSWVEFYIKFENGDIYGWQCKHIDRVSEWKEQIKSSLSKSYKTYWDKLKKWYLCSKNDLTPDSVNKSWKKINWEHNWFHYELDKTKIWNHNILPQGHWVALIHWWDSELNRLLSKYPNIYNYFFEDKNFTWWFFEDKYNENLNSSISNKYISELHTDNQLSDILNIILWWEYFTKKLKNAIKQFKIKYYVKWLGNWLFFFKKANIHNDYLKIKAELIQQLELINTNILSLLGELEKLSYSRKNDWITKIEECINAINTYNELEKKLVYSNKSLDCYIVEEYDDWYGSSLDELWIDNNENSKRIANRGKLIRNNLNLWNILEFLSQIQIYFSYFKSQELHISWSAWVGKTHTLFNIYETFIKTNQPALFILWQSLINNELFEIQIKELLDIPNNLGVDDFLWWLNKMWDIYNCKIPIIIDWLNESLNWKTIFTNLSWFITKINKYSNLVLITTYRSNYEHEIFSDYKLTNGWSYEYWNKYFLDWFTWDFNILLDRYFQHYNISIQNNFNKYVFEEKLIYLKMFCEVNKWKEVNINSLSFSETFDSYIEKCNKDICKKLDKDLALNRTFSIDILKKMWLELWNNNFRLISKNEFIKEILGEKGLTAFLREDLILFKNLNWLNDDSIWFTYDLFWWYIIAKNLFESNKMDMINFLKSNVFKEKILEKGHPLFDDILECLILLLFQEKIFIFDYLQDDLVVEKLIEIIQDLDKESLNENKSKILPFLETQFKWNYKTKIFQYYFNKPFDLDNPVNARFWHSILFDLSLADRDEIWSIKISNDYTINDWMDQLKNKTNELKDKYKDWDEKLLLIWNFFSWFLSTTNNKNRDKITKLLVELFTDKPISYLKLLKNFIKVNDPYIIQRILAIWLWIIIRSDTSDEVKNVVKFIYEHYYINSNVPIDILSRDYIKTIVEYWYKKLWLADIDLNITKYPYTSELNIEVLPTFEELEKYSDSIYSWKDWYHDYIWSSVMYTQWNLADFWRYVLGSKVNHWLNIKLTETKIPIVEELEKEFFESLTKKQLDEFNKFKKIESKEFLKIFYKSISENDDEEEEEEKDDDDQYLSDKLEIEFIKKLNDNQFKKYTQYNDFKSKTWVFEGINWFDTKVAERWLYDRIIKLWYDVSKYWDFDKRVWRMYHERWWNDIERIWKKYQWIALYELLARISDNYKFRDDWYSDKEIPFKSPQSIIRDIDPTYISKLNELWWFDEELNKYLYTTISNKDFINNPDNLALWDWISSESWIPNYKELIERKDNNWIEWIALEWFFSITEKSDKDDIEYDWKKQFWNHMRSYLVNKEDFLWLKDWLWDKSLMWRELMPESSDNHYSYLWEWYWSEWYNELHIPYYGYQEWTNNDEKLPKEVMVTVENYYSERWWDDVEWYWNTKILMLSRYLAEKIWANWNDKKSAIVDKDWDIIWFNPILYWVKENSLLIRKDVLLKFLDDNNLEIIFTILWEKLVLWRVINDRNIINWLYYLNENRNIDWDYNMDLNPY